MRRCQHNTSFTSTSQAVHFLEEPGSIRGALCCIAAQLAQRLPLVRQQLVEQLASKDLTSTSVEEASLSDLFKQLLSKPLWKLDKRKDERPEHLVLVLDGVQVLQEEKDYQLVQQVVTGRCAGLSLQGGCMQARQLKPKVQCHGSAVATHLKLSTLCVRRMGQIGVCAVHNQQLYMNSA